MKTDRGPLEILFVDDSASLRTVVAQALTRAGNRVTLAVDGEQALAIFAAGRFDIVLTDFAMPNGNGTELASAIRERAPRQRIILFSGYTEALPTGGKPDSVDLVLRKPMTLHDLTSAVSLLSDFGSVSTN